MLKMFKYAALATSLVAGAFVAGCSDDGTVADGGVADTGIHPDGSVRMDATTAADSGSDAGVTPDAGQEGCPAWAGTQPANTVALNFVADDSANRTYTSTDGLAWKGSMKFDSATRCITRDTSWSGPFALLYDDGPWNTGGHEPAGATAADHKFGVTVFFPSPVATSTIDYGLVSDWAPGGQGNWLWQGPNGAVHIPANSTAPIDATGFTFPAFGTVDLKLVIDTATRAAGFETWMPALGVTVKSSGWGWVESPATDDGMAGDDAATDAKYTFVIGERAGRGNLRHVGKYTSGQEIQFVFVLGGVEYKVAQVPSTAGVHAYTKAMGAATWTEVPVMNKPDGDKNTFIVIP